MAWFVHHTASPPTSRLGYPHRQPHPNPNRAERRGGGGGRAQLPGEDTIATASLLPHTTATAWRASGPAAGRFAPPRTEFVMRSPWEAPREGAVAQLPRNPGTCGARTPRAVVVAPRGAGGKRRARVGPREGAERVAETNLPAATFWGTSQRPDAVGWMDVLRLQGLPPPPG